jgi:hypothetical protein
MIRVEPLTPRQFKAALKALGLSQGRAAKLALGETLGRRPA